MSILSESLENYLEAVFLLEKKYRVARIKDIAKFLGVQMSSVTSALKKLRERGLVNYSKNHYITLTDSGKQAAENIIFKHSILEDFLKKVLSIDPDTASREALSMKHAISMDTAYQIKNLFLE